MCPRLSTAYHLALQGEQALSQSRLSVEAAEQQPGQALPPMMAASAEQRRRYSRFVSWGKGDVNVALALEARYN